MCKPISLPFSIWKLYGHDGKYDEVSEVGIEMEESTREGLSGLYVYDCRQQGVPASDAFFAYLPSLPNRATTSENVKADKECSLSSIGRAITRPRCVLVIVGFEKYQGRPMYALH